MMRVNVFAIAVGIARAQIFFNRYERAGHGSVVTRQVGQTSRSARVLQDPPFALEIRPTWTSAAGYRARSRREKQLR